MKSFRLVAPVSLVISGAACPAAANEPAKMAAVDAGLRPAAVFAARPSRSNCGINRFDKRFLTLINHLRTSGASCGWKGSFGPVRPLGWSPRLTLSADGHAIDMAQRNYFGHISPGDGRTVEHRLSAVGYNWSEFAENLAAGLMTVEDVMSRWANSPVHCANLMNPNFTELGAACAPAVMPGRFRTYWTMDLAGP